MKIEICQRFHSSGLSKREQSNRDTLEYRINGGVGIIGGVGNGSIWQ